MVRCWKKPTAYIAAVFVFGLAWALLNSTKSVFALKDYEPNRIDIEYVPTDNPDFKEVYDMLKEKKALETIQEIFGPVLLPEVLTFKTKECGMMNAWYMREDSKPTVTLCYDLLNHIMQTVPKEATPEGITAIDAKLGQFIWFSTHEAGHAMFDIFDVPVFGHEEDAADNFAGFVMLHLGKDQSKRLIKGAAWQWKEYISDYRTNPEVKIRLAGFASNHGQPEQRFYDLMCMAYGADPVLFADLTNDGYLPPTRAPSCRYEYRTLAYAFKKEITPHLDIDKLQSVWDMQWLPDTSAMPRHSPLTSAR